MQATVYTEVGFALSTSPIADTSLDCLCNKAVWRDAVTFPKATSINFARHHAGLVKVELLVVRDLSAACVKTSFTNLEIA